jgi:hypothetical protein
MGDAVRFCGREIQRQAKEELVLEDVLVYPIGVRVEGCKVNIYHLMHVRITS